MPLLVKRHYETAWAFNSVLRWVYFKIIYHDWKTRIRAFCGHVTPSCVSSFALTLCWPCKSVSFVTVVGNRQTRFSTTVTRLSLIWAPLNSSLHIGQKKERTEKKSEVLRCFSLMALCWLLLKTRCEYVCESKASLMKSCTHTWTGPIAISSWGEKIQVLTVIGKFHLNLLADVHRISQATDMEKGHFKAPPRLKNVCVCRNIMVIRSLVQHKTKQNKQTKNLI